MSVALVTGFGPFAHEQENPSGMIAGRLDGELIDGLQVHGAVLPVATQRVGQALGEALARVRPEFVLLLGVARGRTAPALERVAINVRDFPLPDVDGRCPVDEPVVAGGPAAHLSDLPVKAILAAWREAGIPGYVSNTAGTYVCNQAFYLAAHRGLTDGFRAGLVHLPTTPPSAAAQGPAEPSPVVVPPPSLALELAEQAVRVALGVLAHHRGADLALSAGAIS